MNHTLNIMLSTLALCFLSLLPINNARAQSAKPDETLRTRFRIIVWNADQPAGICYRKDGKLVKVDALSPSSRSKFYDYSGPPTMLLYPTSSAKSTKSEAELEQQPIANVIFPPSVKYPLVLLVPNKGGPYPYRGIVFDEDPAVFPFKSYLFVSFSGTRVATSIGDDRFILEPLQTHLLTSERKNLNLRMAISLENGSDWRVIKDDFYPNWPGFRTVFFLIDSVKEGRPHIEIRSLYEAEASWNEAVKR
jgi:hypothetical protein